MKLAAGLMLIALGAIQTSADQSTQKRRLFQTVDLGLLEAPDRDE
jgi:hypothetical protein